MHACTHARTHACTHAHTHACMHARTHTHTHNSQWDPDPTLGQSLYSHSRGRIRGTGTGPRSGCAHRQQIKGCAAHRQKIKGCAAHRQKIKGCAAHRLKGCAAHRQQMKGCAAHRQKTQVLWSNHICSTFTHRQQRQVLCSTQTTNASVVQHTDSKHKCSAAYRQQTQLLCNTQTSNTSAVQHTDSKDKCCAAHRQQTQVLCSNQVCSTFTHSLRWVRGVQFTLNVFENDQKQTSLSAGLTSLRKIKSKHLCSQGKKLWERPKVNIFVCRANVFEKDQKQTSLFPGQKAHRASPRHMASCSVQNLEQTKAPMN